MFEIDYVQQADVITFDHKDYKPCELQRLNHDNWVFEEILFESSIKAPSGLEAVYTGSTSSNTTTWSESQRTPRVTCSGILSKKASRAGILSETTSVG